ncbi:MAG: ATP-binding cassette domain-containing protein [Rhodospirillales bacterium]
MSSEILRLENISKRFGNIVACNELSVDFYPGTCTAVIGPNGAGKTTIMNIVAGSLIPDLGSVRWGGHELVGMSQHRIANLGIVRMFQDLKVFDGMTVYENLVVASGRGVGGWSLGKIERRSGQLIDETLQRLGLSGHANRLTHDLSYAERKLVALGRAICSGGKILLLDEPASGMDKASLKLVLDTVVSLRNSGAIIVIVEHNLSIVQELASYALLLEEGKIIASGEPAELYRNSNFGRVYFSLLQ